MWLLQPHSGFFTFRSCANVAVSLVQPRLPGSSCTARHFRAPIRAPSARPNANAVRILGRSKKSPWRVMETYATADLAAQLGDLALNTRVEIHDLDRPDLNGR